MRFGLQAKYFITLIVCGIVLATTITFYQIYLINKFIVQRAQESIERDSKQAFRVLNQKVTTTSMVADLLFPELVHDESYIKEKYSLDILFSSNNHSNNFSSLESYIIKQVFSFKNEFGSGFMLVPSTLLENKANYKLDLYALTYSIDTHINHDNFNKLNCLNNLILSNSFSKDSLRTNLNHNWCNLRFIISAINLTKNNLIAKDLQKMLFEKGEMNYIDKPIKTVTIFTENQRASTTVKNDDNSYAIGTLVSDEVKDKVLISGRSWFEVAQVANEKYYAKYDPIKDLNGQIVGMLYIGSLKRYFDSIKSGILAIGIIIVISVISLVFLIISLVTERVIITIFRLNKRMGRIKNGQLNQQLKVNGNDEIYELAESFNAMSKMLVAKEEKINEQWREILSANHKYMDLLSVVSIDLKNHLSSSMFLTDLLIDGSYGDLSKDQADGLTLLKESLDYINKTILSYLVITNAKGGELMIERRRVSLVSDSIAPSLKKLEKRIFDRSLDIVVTIPENLVVAGDSNLLEIVFRNILINLVDFVEMKEEITISSLVTGTMAIVSVTTKIRIDSVERVSRLSLLDEFTEERTTNKAQRSTENPSIGGVGVFMIKQIIDQHGGKIWFEREASNYISLKFNLLI